MVTFYILCPVPMLIARRYADSVEASSALVEMCIFITTGIVISAYGLPIVLAHTPHNAPVVSLASGVNVSQQKIMQGVNLN